MNPRDSLPIVALATGVALLAAEVRRVTREREALAKSYQGLVDRMAERSTTVLHAAPEPVPTIDPEPAYVSDLPYHDDAWDDFTNANEKLPSVEDEDV